MPRSLRAVDRAVNSVRSLSPVRRSAIAASQPAPCIAVEALCKPGLRAVILNAQARCIQELTKQERDFPTLCNFGYCSTELGAVERKSRCFGSKFGFFYLSHLLDMILALSGSVGGGCCLQHPVLTVLQYQKSPLWFGCTFIFSFAEP